MAKATLTIEGFIATEMKVREVTGHRIVDVTVPVTPQKKNQQGVWEDSGDTVWFKAAFWDEHGDAVLGSVEKGSLVTLTGTPKLDLYLKEGAAAGSISLDFPTIAKVVRRPKRGGSTEGQWAPSTPAPADPAGDSWNTPPAQSDETPF